MLSNQYINSAILSKRKSIESESNFFLIQIIFFILMSMIYSTISAGQTILPQYTGSPTPIPSPLPPGDAFNLPMSGTTSATAPACAEWTRTAGPDESLVVTGSRFSNYTGLEEGRDSRFTLYDGSVTTKEAKIQRLDGNKAIITLAHNISRWSMYLVWPGNEVGYGAPIAINQTDSWWVGPDKATLGDTVSVYGRNLAHENDTITSYVFIKPTTGVGQWAQVVKVNPYKVTFVVPASLVNGDYEVWTHNGHGGRFGWSGPLTLHINTSIRWSLVVFNVRNYSATGDGYTDDTQAIQNALSAARQVPNSTIYFPVGVYMISSFLAPSDNTRWLGDGKRDTMLKCAPNFSSQSPAFLYGAVNNFEMREIGFYGNGNYRGVQPEPIFLRGSTNILLSNVLLFFQDSNVLQLDNSYGTIIENCELVGMVSFLGHASHIIINRCRFKLTNDAEMALDSWGGSCISLTNSSCQDYDNSNPNNGAGWGKGRFYASRGNFGSSYFTYIANNTTSDLAVRPIGADPNSGEQYMWEGYSTEWAGSVTSSTERVTTLNNFSYSYDNVHHAVITAGTGFGQSRKIVSYNGSTITLDQPWNLPPDSTSIISISNADDRTVLYKNYIDGKLSMVNTPIQNASAGIEPYGTILNFIADHNRLHELRSGIANWATQNIAELDPNYFSLYTNNEITNCRWAIQNGLYMNNPKESGMLGITYRRNIISNISQSAIVNTLSPNNNLSVFNSFVYEHNLITNSGNGFSTGGDAGLPQGFASSGVGIENQIFYKNSFSGSNAPNGFGVKSTQESALRENTFIGFVNSYTGVLPLGVLEAPSHVIEINGNTGARVVDASFVLWNSGPNSMDWTATSNSSWLTLSIAGGTIVSEADSSIVLLHANPTGMAVGDYTAIMIVTANGQVRKYNVIYKITTAPVPSVSIASPFNSNWFPVSTPITIKVNASIQNDTISKIEFFAGIVKLGEINDKPYQYVWNSTTPGTYALLVKATTASGMIVSSAPVQVVISSPLPVSLISFTATPINAAVQLNWSIANEYSNVGFQVQHSANGSSYIQIGSISGQGNSTGEHQYTLLDNTPLAGKNYYRLKQVNIDGNSTYSPIVVANMNTEQLIGGPYPSPASNYLTIPNLYSIIADFRIINSLSETILSGKTASGATLNIQGLPTGLYYLELSIANQRVIRKFIKTE